MDKQTIILLDDYKGWAGAQKLALGCLLIIFLLSLVWQNFFFFIVVLLVNATLAYRGAEVAADVLQLTTDEALERTYWRKCRGQLLLAVLWTIIFFVLLFLLVKTPL